MSSVTRPKSVGTYLTDDENHLTRLCHHAGFLASLERKLHGFLQDPMQNYCKLANVSGNTVVLHVETAAWAARLRYSTPAILKFMQQECGLNSLQTIRIRVKPPVAESKQATGEKPRLSSTAAGILRHAAATVTDEELRQSLQKIASNYRDY